MFLFFKRFPTISTTDLAKKLNKSMIILDVRTPKEYHVGHIQNAINVPLDKIQHYKSPKDKQIYVVCQSGIRSKKAATRLQKMGYDVINVRGGMNQWTGSTKGGK